MTLQTDNGGEFGEEFDDELPDNVQLVKIPRTRSTRTQLQRRNYHL